ncbi:hypothetical protein LRP49_25095, partial [Enterovibrio sp. ZSDZ35]|nr:hypothetical protein [Enterovibrio sp. ZSDZ35]
MPQYFSTINFLVSYPSRKVTIRKRPKIAHQQFLTQPPSKPLRYSAPYQYISLFLLVNTSGTTLAIESGTLIYPYLNKEIAMPTPCYIAIEGKTQGNIT